MVSILTKQYLTLTHKAQARDRKVVKQAVNSMVTEDKLDIFMELLDHISDTTIVNYIKEIGQHKLSSSTNSTHTDIYYLYGGKINEIVFRNIARFIEKNYPNAKTMCLNGKGALRRCSFETTRAHEIVKSIIGEIAFRIG